MPDDDRFSRLIDDVSSQFENFDLVPEGIEARDTGTSNYVKAHRHEYIRTLRDVIGHFEPRPEIDVFEIGAFFGVVSIALARHGYRVTASDVPDYIALPEQQQRFSGENVRTNELRLEDYLIDAPDESQDCVIMCEVLEHLNFNPLPLLKEINRILRPDGLFYLSLPNQAQIRNRLDALRGRGIGIDVAGLYSQLDPTDANIANGHWREYTMAEIDALTGPLGFAPVRQYYFGLGETLEDGALRKRLGRAFYRLFPAFKENQTHLLRRASRTRRDFAIPPTVHRTLRRV